MVSITHWTVQFVRIKIDDLISAGEAVIVIRMHSNALSVTLLFSLAGHSRVGRGISFVSRFIWQRSVFLEPLLFKLLKFYVTRYLFFLIFFCLPLFFSSCIENLVLFLFF